jgi:hypothetical protein
VTIPDPLLAIFHVGAAILACWRLTELITSDRISARLRKRYPIYLWSCPRCVSVWAGIVTIVAYLYLPWLNWPLALAWTYLVHLDWVLARRQARWPKQIVLSVDEHGNTQIVRSDVNPGRVIEAFRVAGMTATP